MTIRLRYFAAARAGAGCAEESLDFPPGSTLAHVAAALPARHPGLVDVLPACSYLVNALSVPASRAVDPLRAPALAAGDTVDVLPPFAGG